MADAAPGPNAKARCSLLSLTRRSMVSEARVRSLLTATAESMARTRSTCRDFPNRSITRPRRVKESLPLLSMYGAFMRRENWVELSMTAESPRARISDRSSSTFPHATKSESPSPLMLSAMSTTGSPRLRPNESFSKSFMVGRLVATMRGRTRMPRMAR